MHVSSVNLLCASDLFIHVHTFMLRDVRKMVIFYSMRLFNAFEWFCNLQISILIVF